MVCRRIKPLLRKSLYEKEKNREIHFKISSFIVAFAYEEFFEGCNVQKNNAADNQLVTYYYHEQLTYAHFHKMHSFCNFTMAKLLQKSEMRKDIVIELSYKGFG